MIHLTDSRTLPNAQSSLSTRALSRINSVRVNLSTELPCDGAEENTDPEGTVGECMSFILNPITLSSVESFSCETRLL